MLNPPVNKRLLSTRETGEFASKNVGSGRNLGVEFECPRSLTSNQRERTARKKSRNVADTGEGNGWRCSQENWPLELGRKGVGSPAWIRTTIHGSKGRCPTIRRPGNYYHRAMYSVYPAGEPARKWYLAAWHPLYTAARIA